MTPTVAGMYDECTAYVVDHAGNISNAITLPFFVFGMGDASICFDDAMTIPRQECLVLASLYQYTNGSGRTNTNNRLEDTDADSRFGINVVAVT